MSHSLSMPHAAPFSWRRSSAISATLGFHAAVLLLLLAPPVAKQIVPALKPDPITVIVKDPPPPPPPPPPPIDVKPFVKPPPLARLPVQAPPKPEPMPTADPTPMSTPVDTQPPGPQVDSTPAETAPTPLGYSRRHAVPYPRTSVIHNEQGTVILRVLIGSDGVPQRIEIEKSSGFPALDRAAREAVLKWRFTAGTKDGVPYTAWGRVPVEFQLEKQ